MVKGRGLEPTDIIINDLLSDNNSDFIKKSKGGKYVRFDTIIFKPEEDDVFIFCLYKGKIVIEGRSENGFRSGNMFTFHVANGEMRLELKEGG